MNLRQRIVLRALGVKISEDGSCWTAPRKRQRLVEQAFAEAAEELWRDNPNADELADVRKDADGIMFAGPKQTIILRWVP